MLPDERRRLAIRVRNSYRAPRPSFNAVMSYFKDLIALYGFWGAIWYVVRYTRR